MKKFAAFCATLSLTATGHTEIPRNKQVHSVPGTTPAQQVNYLNGLRQQGVNEAAPKLLQR